MELKKLAAIAKQRHHLLDELSGYLNLMDNALEKNDIVLYERLERDFNHILKQLNHAANRV